MGVAVFVVVVVVAATTTVFVASATACVEPGKGAGVIAEWVGKRGGIGGSEWAGRQAGVHGAAVVRVGVGTYGVLDILFLFPLRLTYRMLRCYYYILL